MRRHAKGSISASYMVNLPSACRKAEHPAPGGGSHHRSLFRAVLRYQELHGPHIAFAREHGYVETILGRRRYLRDINSNNAIVRGFAERNAINAPIQGSSADMIKIAMIRIHEELARLHTRSKMILQVHDELVFDGAQVRSRNHQAYHPRPDEARLPLDVPIEVEWMKRELAGSALDAGKFKV